MFTLFIFTVLRPTHRRRVCVCICVHVHVFDIFSAYHLQHRARHSPIEPASRQRQRRYNTRSSVSSFVVPLSPAESVCRVRIRCTPRLHTPSHTNLVRHVGAFIFLSGKSLFAHQSIDRRGCSVCVVIDYIVRVCVIDVGSDRTICDRDAACCSCVWVVHSVNNPQTHIVQLSKIQQEHTHT